MKNGKYTIYFVFFIAVLLVPFAGMLIMGPSKSENSNVKTFPKPFMEVEDGDGRPRINKDYLKQLGEYFEGHCAFRQDMVTGYSMLTTKVLQTSSSKSVIYGKNGWMFYTDTLGDYTGSEVMTEREMFDAVRTLKLIDRYCKENGMEFCFVTAANKNSLYSENMPYYYKKTDKPGNRELLGEKIKAEGITYIDLYDTFAKEGKVLYHKTDSHWTNEGAALAARTIHRTIKTDYFDDFFDRYGRSSYTVRKDFEGDLAAMMYPSKVPLEEEIYYNDGPVFEYVGKVKSNFDNKIRTTGIIADNLLMYRDSFGNSLLPFMAEPFKNASFSRSLTVQVKDFESFKPNVVIIEKAERFLPQLAENPPKLPATEIEGNPVGMKELEGAKYKISSFDGYTTIKGTLEEGTYSGNTRIYVGIGGHWYEAYPFHEDGKECFQVYVKDFAEGTDIKIIGTKD